MMGFKKGNGKDLKIDGLTVEMIVKIKTNFKLNLFDKSRNQIISNNMATNEEVHFVKFEGIYPEFEFSPEALKKSL